MERPGKVMKTAIVRRALAARFLVASLLLLLLSPSAVAAAGSVAGTVVDEATGAVIAGAVVVASGRQTFTDAAGHFTLPMETDVIGGQAGDTAADTAAASAQRPAAALVSARAPGYRRKAVALHADSEVKITLAQIRPKALYLSTYGIGSSILRQDALDVIKAGGLNAIVIDMKGDSGLIPYPSAIKLAAEDGALRVRTVSDLPALVADLQARGLYTIARIVVFRDNLLATARPGWAVHGRDGRVWQDSMGQAWIDPFRREAWDYAIAVAVEAAAAGFDEIQFDYVRFPDTLGLQFAAASTEDSRMTAITGFLQQAREHLRPYNVFLAADVFGYICWNRNDTYIGQRLEEIAAQVDYISPMLYPSGFQFGIPGYRNPVEAPYAIVFNSLKTAGDRIQGYPVRFRPWLQAFRDYAFDRRRFGAAEIGAQIRAAEDAGAMGWMLWNPRNTYSTEGLVKEQSNAGQ